MTLTTKLVASAGFLALLTGLTPAAPAVSAQAQAAAIGGNNPMKNEKSTANPNLPRSQGQAAAIGGNNAMKNEKSTSNPNLPRPQGQAAAIGGNNPMKNEKSTTAAGAGTPSVTNSRASRGHRRATTGAGANR